MCEKCTRSVREVECRKDFWDDETLQNRDGVLHMRKKDAIGYIAVSFAALPLSFTLLLGPSVVGSPCVHAPKKQGLAI